jgi:hypothetical protein
MRILCRAQATHEVFIDVDEWSGEARAVPALYAQREPSPQSPGPARAACRAGE